jgi:hypothetical protein
VQSRHLGPNDIVVAEEVLMQTYYLGHVDYWLQVPSYAAAFVTRVGDRFVDEYTATPVIGTAAGLQQLLMQSDRGAIYVIGSGDQDDGEQPRRGPEIDRVLRSGEFKVVYIARDGRTKVWMADAPAASAVQNR